MRKCSLLIAGLLISAAILFAASQPVAADTLAGRVIGISDGDTITVLDAKNSSQRVRLSGINAPKDIAVHREEIYQRIAPAKAANE